MNRVRFESTWKQVRDINEDRDSSVFTMFGGSVRSGFVEGSYVVELVGGGGGGGSELGGGGGGGGGAVPSRTVQYLSPGVYKLTIGTGGQGGSANGGTTEAGNPTSLTNALGSSR